MKYLYIFFLLIISLPLVAQTTDKKEGIYIKGTVCDSISKEPLPSALVNLRRQNDSVNVKFAQTTVKGNFTMSVGPGKYILEITFMGYKPFYKDFTLSGKNTSYSFGEILMIEDSYLLGEAVVEAAIPNIVVKGDTIEYNAASYSSQESDMLQDIIKNIPGIEIDREGNITANGKPVKKILVDGKEFFGNDIPMALSNLPANMIKRLQLYKEESESAKITGFKDKNPEQVLNLVVKDELKQSVFGEGKAGYGSSGKYTTKALVNYMRNDNQVSFVSNMNNVNDNEFSTTNRDTGIDRNKNVGISTYIQSSEKLKIGGNLRYNNNQNEMETQTNTQTFLSTGDRFAKQNSKTKNERQNLNTGVNMQWEPDSLTMIFARSYISFNNSKNTSTATNMSYVSEKDTTSGQSLNRSKGDGYSFNNFITMGRKLNNKGRTVSLSFNQSMRNDKSKGTNYSLTKYTDGTEDKIIDQRSDTENKSDNFNLSFSYVEPLSKDRLLQFSYSYGQSNSKRIRNVRRKDNLGNYSIVDSAYTRNTRNKFINQNLSLNFQTNKEKYSYTVGISVDPSNSHSKVTLGDSIIDDLKQNVINFSPTLNFTYKPNENTNIDFNYSGSSSQPDITQISGDTVIVNALTKYFGNPDLKPSYSNNFNLYYQKSDYETSRFFMISGNFNYTFNNIVDYTTIDDLGNTTNTYKNVSGDLGAGINIMFDTPLKNKKFSINNNAYANYYKNIGYTNGEKAITHNVVLNERVSGRFKSKKFETTLEAGITYNMTKNNLTDTQNRNTKSYKLRHFALLRLPYDFTIQSDIECSFYSGYGEDFKNSEVLWNASVSKQFLKNKKGNLRFQFFDILNNQNNIFRTVSGNYISDSRSNTINQYFMVSFSYKFNVLLGGKGKKSNDSAGNEDYGYGAMY